MSTYSETLDYLYSRLPMYQRIGKTAFKKDLTNTVRLMEGLDNPHKKFKSIHIAGTNGKGTSAHALAAILQTAGYKTGLYTSPHLKNFTERIKINGEEVSREFVIQFVDTNRQLIEEVNPSFFEVTVAMAFDFFEKESVDIAVIETGLGGRLDSTNVITPEVSLITNIGLEHTDLLGDTIEEIAFEKAGIIKPEIPVVVGSDMEPNAVEVVRKRALDLNSPFSQSKAGSSLPDSPNWPPYFAKNLPGVLETINQLSRKDFSISMENITNGLNDFQNITGLKGRFQKINDQPSVIADVSHNADGLRLLFEHVNQLSYSNLHIIFGTVKDKDLEPIFRVLPRGAQLYFTQSSVPRSLSVGELMNAATRHGLHGVPFDDVNDAKKAALKNAASDDLIFITGSTFVVADLEEL